MKRIATLALCLALLAPALAACSEPGVGISPSQNYYWEGLEQPSDSGGADPVPQIDYDAAFAMFSPDAVMLTMGEYQITWAEMFFHLRSVLGSLISNYGGLPDLSELVSEDTTYAQAVMQYAIDNAVVYKAVEHGAKQYGVTFDAEDEETLQTEFVGMADTYGGIDEFLKILWEEDGIYSYDIFYYLYSIPYLLENIFDDVYGVDGELLTDEMVSELIGSEEYLMAKHILRMKTEDGDTVPLEETEEILRQLDEYEGDDFDAFFDSLMNENSEDAGGLASFPNGYLFQYGDMVQEFYNGCLSLEIGEYSRAVETTYGYHIIYRLPVSYDEVPMYYASQYDYRTLRSIAARGALNTELQEWVELMNPVKNPEFESLDLSALFSYS